MSQTPAQGPVVEVRPQPNVYTILLLIAIIALGIAVGVCYWKLTSPPAAGGYGMEFGEFFEPLRRMAR